MTYTIITGASSGIGRATAFTLAEHNRNLILVSRDLKRLNTLKEDILAVHNSISIQVFSVDLSVSEEVHRLIKILDNYEIDILINNAGFGIAGPILDSDPISVENMISLDVSSLVTLSLWFAKKYKAVKGKQLLNVSSTAGYEINTRAVLYSASKNFVASFTEGLAIELRNNDYPLQAKVLAPYATETNFAKTSLGIENFSYQENYQNYHTAQQMSEFIVQLLESNQIVGRVNAQNMQFELTDTLLTWFA
jgi:uncharacterized protein